MKDKLKNRISEAFRNLMEDDGELFGRPVEEGFGYDARKLHEVCINHKFANHLEKEVIPILKEILEKDEKIFVDIEFNKEGGNLKYLKINNKDQVVRPDIIIHNRKREENKFNFLIVECKKQNSPSNEINEDLNKIDAFLRDSKYEYQFGLQVLYGNPIKGTLFYKNGKGEIKNEPIVYPLEL